MTKPKLAKLAIALRHTERAARAATELGNLDILDCDDSTPPADYHLAHAVADLESAIHHLEVVLDLYPARPKPSPK